MATTRSPRQTQRGSALIVALILLVVAALLGIGAVQSGMMGTAHRPQCPAHPAGPTGRPTRHRHHAEPRWRHSPARYAPATSDQSIDIDGDGTADFSVTLDRPACVAIANAQDTATTQPAQGHDLGHSRRRHRNRRQRECRSHAGHPRASADFGRLPHLVRREKTMEHPCIAARRRKRAGSPAPRRLARSPSWPRPT